MIDLFKFGTQFSVKPVELVKHIKINIFVSRHLRAMEDHYYENADSKQNRHSQTK